MYFTLLDSIAMSSLEGHVTLIHVTSTSYHPNQLALPVALLPPVLRFPPRPARFALRFDKHVSQYQRP